MGHLGFRAFRVKGYVGHLGVLGPFLNILKDIQLAVDRSYGDMWGCRFRNDMARKFEHDIETGFIKGFIRMIASSLVPDINLSCRVSQRDLKSTFVIASLLFVKFGVCGSYSGLGGPGIRVKGCRSLHIWKQTFLTDLVSIRLSQDSRCCSSIQSTFILVTRLQTLHFACQVQREGCGLRTG